MGIMQGVHVAGFRSNRKSISAALVGNVLEWYDFSLYGFMAPILSKIFFPHQTSGMALLSVYLLFAASFLMRPVGAIVYGYFGDTRGRRGTLLVSLLAIGLPSMLMGLLPSYQTLGVMAPVLLILLRLLQGFSAGGEFGGSVSYLVESAPAGKSGLYGGLSYASAMSGVLLAALAAAVLSHVFMHEKIIAYAWRIPFLFGAIMIAVGSYLRYGMKESPVFKSLTESQFLLASPTKNMFTRHIFVVVKAAMVVCLGGVINFSIIVYLPTYLHIHRGFAMSAVFLMSTLALLVVVFLSVVVGYLTKFYSRKKVMLWACLGTVIIGWFFSRVISTGTLQTIFIMQLLLACLQGAYFGAQMTYLVELFPANVRYSGLSLGYNIGYAVFSGMTPFMLQYFVRVGNISMAILVVLLSAALVSFIGLMIGKKKRILFIPGLGFGEKLFQFQKDYFQDNIICEYFLVEHNQLSRNIDKISHFFSRKSFHIVAHSSLGAGVALAAAAKFPDRIKKVICFPGWVSPNDFMKSFLQQSLDDIASGGFSDFKSMLLNAAISEKQPDRKTIMSDYRADVQDAVPMNQVIRQMHLLKNELDITACLSEVKASVWIIRNMDNDPWFSKEEAMQLSDAVSRPNSVVIDNIGHLAPYTSATLANALIELAVND